MDHDHGIELVLNTQVLLFHAVGIRESDISWPPCTTAVRGHVRDDATRWYRAMYGSPLESICAANEQLSDVASFSGSSSNGDDHVRLCFVGAACVR